MVRNMKVDSKYFKSVNGVIKVGEFIGLIICIAMMTSFEVELDSADQSNQGRYHSFYLFVTITCLALVLVTYITRLTTIHRRLPMKWIMLIIVTSGLSFLFILISSSLIANDAANFDSEKIENDKTQCDLWKEKDVSCSLYIAAGVIGLLVAILFLVETILVLYGHLNGGILDVDLPIQEGKASDYVWDDGGMDKPTSGMEDEEMTYTRNEESIRNEEAISNYENEDSQPPQLTTTADINIAQQKSDEDVGEANSEQS